MKSDTSFLYIFRAVIAALDFILPSFAYQPYAALTTVAVLR